MVEKPLEFFGFKNLKGFSYYFYLPSFSLEQKKTFTDLITRHQGVIVLLILYRREHYHFTQIVLL